MNHRKSLKARPYLDKVAILTATFVLISQLSVSNAFSPLAALKSLGLGLGLSDLSCPDDCSCSIESIATVMQEHSQKHSELNPFYYVDFFGIYLRFMRSMVKVSCTLADRKMHTISSLLNGMEATHYTALDVKCISNERLVWDVPVWQASVNVFTSKNCELTPADTTRAIAVPMNLWIMEVYGGGKGQFEYLDMLYANNMIALILSDTQAEVIPNTWKKSVMMSANTVRFSNNQLQKYECEVSFKHHLDTLSLAGNDISVFPECLLRHDHVSISKLSLSRNVISNISALYQVETNKTSPEITVIDLSHNEIRSLETFRYMPKLRDLDLSYNLIEELNKESLAGLVNLETLNLEHNRIFKIGNDVFGYNDKLSSVSLSHNYLTHVTAYQFPGKASTMDVDIRQNKLQYPPLQDCANKKLLDLRVRFLAAGNPFHCDCKAIPFEECLQWIGSENASLSKEVYMDLDNLHCTYPKKTKGNAYTHLPFGTKCLYEEDCPQGCQCYMMNSEKIVVDCSGQHLLEMPEMIPTGENKSVALYLDHNPLQMLCYRSYLRAVSELYLHNCLLTTVTPGAIAALQNVQTLALHNNYLQKLPSSARSLIKNRAKNVTLHNNRWACSCESLWLPRWITRHRHLLWAPGSILCRYLRKPVAQFSDTDVVCSKSGHLELAVAASLVIAAVVSTLTIVFYYRAEINQLLYSRFGVRCCNTFNYGDDYSPYDAFVVYSQDNYKWIVDVLLPMLEDGHKRYRLCMHYRDFPAGESSVENIPWAISLSRCSIMLLSRDFITKEWRIPKVQAAFQRMLFTSHRLIVVATEDIQMEELTPDLRAYMNTHEFLRLGEPNFWSKLELFMPPPRFHPNADTPEALDMAGAGGDNDKKAPFPSEARQGKAQDMEEAGAEAYTVDDETMRWMSDAKKSYDI